ncbi:MAG: exodeoxyribonuclease III [Pseudomonadota bacterium]
MRNEFFDLMTKAAEAEALTIATWNINGIKARIDVLLAWLAEAKPDIVCLQEIKSEDAPFPRGPIEDLGYNVETHGQKGFNGVALFSRLPFDEVERGLPGDDDDVQARFIDGWFSWAGGALNVASLYLPNGNPVDSPKLDYKLGWMDRLTRHAKNKLSLETPFVLAGDYNIIPQDEDCFDPGVWQGDALFRPDTRQKFFELCNLGLTEAVRASADAVPAYTFWDYQGGAWQKNHGIRIDHHLMSPEAANMLQSTRIDDHVRAWEKPSDHVPVVVTLAA